MDFKNIQTFIKVCELKNFTAAAAELQYSQSAVSTQIANLEKDLGHKLFERIGHKIELTAQGILFLQYAQNIQILTDDLYTHLNGCNEVSGVVRIAMADSMCTCLFPNILNRFQQSFANVKIIVKTGLISDMFVSLMHNESDIIWILDARTQRPDCLILQESTINVNFYVAANHPLAQKKLIMLPDIRQFPIYLTEENISYRKDLDRIIAEQNEFITPTYEIGNVQVIKNLILHSYGIGFLPEFVVTEEVSQHLIVPISVSGLPVTVWEQLICHKGKVLTPAMQALISFMGM